MDFWDLVDQEFYGYSFKGLVLANFLCIAFYLGCILWLEYFRFYEFNQKSKENIAEDLKKPINFEGFNGFLTIKTLNKQFGELAALKNFTCDFEKGKLFVLLGHNGAGKSTLINIIAGLQEPSSGAIFFEGQNVLENRQLLFQNLGLCDQEDLFYPTFTVQYNLLFLQSLKTGTQDKEEIKKYLSTLSMLDKMESKASDLSGGEKRKLCLAMALIGKSRLVVLDEPTSGMDVSDRKDVWMLLKEVKEERCIILTTHSMDEAELMSDEIGIMADGELIERGTAFELKSRIGNEFTVNVIKNYSKTTPKEEIKEEQEYIFEIAKSICKDAKWKGNTNEILKIGLNCDKTQALEFFNQLDREIKQNKLDDFTYNLVTLEDFFLSATKEDLITCKHIQSIPPIGEELVKVSIFQEIYLNIKLRLLLAVRDYKDYILNLLIMITILNIYTYFLIEGNLSTTNFNSADTFNSNIKFAYLTHPSLSVDQVTPLVPSEVSQTILDTETLNSPEEFRSYLINKNFQRNEYHMIVYFKSVSKKGVEAYLMQNKILSISGAAFLMKINSIFNPEILSPTYDYFNSAWEANLRRQKTGFSFFLVVILVFSYFRMLISSLRLIVNEKVQNIKQFQKIHGTSIFSYWISIFVVDILKITFFLLLCWNIFQWFFIPLEYLIPLVSAFTVTVIIYYYLLSKLFSNQFWIETMLTIYIILAFLLVYLVFSYSIIDWLHNTNFLYSFILFFPEINMMITTVKITVFLLN